MQLLQLIEVALAYPNCVVVVSGIQTVFGSILLFLLGLGIRNRFRMK